HFLLDCRRSCHRQTSLSHDMRPGKYRRNFFPNEDDRRHWTGEINSPTPACRRTKPSSARPRRSFTCNITDGGQPEKNNPAKAGLFYVTVYEPMTPVINRYPGSCAAVRSGWDDGACAAPWLRSGGCARG